MGLKQNEKKYVIAECACDLFWEKGYVQTPVRDIIDSSGYGTSTFYRYFRDKEDCLNYLLDKFLETIIEEVNKYYDSEQGLYQRFIETKRVILVQFVNNPKLTEIYSRVFGISYTIDRTLSEFDADFTQFIVKNIQYGIKAGVFANIPVEPIALAILGTIKFALYKWVVMGEITSNEMIKQVVSFHESLGSGIVIKRDD